MSWVRFDDTLHDHPKVFRLPASARLHCMGIWTFAICWSARHRTDGEVPIDWLCSMGARPRDIAALVDAGLFEASELPGMVRVHDFLDYNPSRAQTEQRREEWRDSKVAAGRIGGRRSAEVRAQRKQDASRAVAAAQAADPTTTTAEVLDARLTGASGSFKQKSSPVPSRPVPSSTGSTEALSPEGWFEAAVEPVEEPETVA